MLVIKFFNKEEISTISDALNHYASLEKQRSREFGDDDQMEEWSSKEIKRIVKLRDYFKKKAV